jgi:hypothetical protein
VAKKAMDSFVTIISNMQYLKEQLKIKFHKQSYFLLNLRCYEIMASLRYQWRNLSKQHFCQHGRHPKIGITNFGGILHHSAHVLRKKKTSKIFLSHVLKITTN